MEAINNLKNDKILSKTLIILTLINLVNYLDRYILAAVAPKVQIDLGLSNFQLGLLMSAFMLGYMIMSPIFGFLGDRMERVTLMIIGVVLWSISTSLSGFANSFLVFFIARMCVGVGEASFATIAPSYIRDHFDQDDEKTNRAFGFFYTAIPVGAALGYIWGGVTSAHFSWHWSFITGGIPGLFLCLILLKVSRGTTYNTPSQAVKNSATFSGAELASYFKEFYHVTIELFKIPQYKLTVLGYTAYTFALGGFAAWAPQYGVHVFKADLANINIALGIVTISSGTIGTLLGGKFGSMFVKDHSNADGQNSVVITAQFNKFNAWTSILALPFSIGLFFIDHYQLYIVDMFIIETLMFAASAPINTAIMTSAPYKLVTLAVAISIFTIHAFGDLISPSLVGAFADFFPMKIAILILPIMIAVSAMFWIKSARAA